MLKGSVRWRPDLRQQVRARGDGLGAQSGVGVRWRRSRRDHFLQQRLGTGLVDDHRSLGPT